MANEIDKISLLAVKRYLHLPHVTVQAHYKDSRIELTTDVFARQIALEIEGAPDTLLEDNFRAYINGFSKNVDDIIEPTKLGRLPYKAYL